MLRHHIHTMRGVWTWQRSPGGFAILAGGALEHGAAGAHGGHAAHGFVLEPVPGHLDARRLLCQLVQPLGQPFALLFCYLLCPSAQLWVLPMCPNVQLWVQPRSRGREGAWGHPC